MLKTFDFLNELTLKYDVVSTVKYDVVSTLKYGIETTLKYDVETMVKYYVETTLKYYVEIWRWNNVEIWRCFNVEIGRCFNVEIWRSFNVEIWRSFIVILKQFLILNHPFGIVHSGKRQRESLLSMQRTPRVRTLVLATAWELSIHKYMVHIGIGLRIYHTQIINCSMGMFKAYTVRKEINKKGWVTMKSWWLNQNTYI